MSCPVPSNLLSSLFFQKHQALTALSHLQFPLPSKVLEHTDPVYSFHKTLFESFQLSFRPCHNTKAVCLKSFLAYHLSVAAVIQPSSSFFIFAQTDQTISSIPVLIVEMAESTLTCFCLYLSPYCLQCPRSPLLHYLSAQPEICPCLSAFLFSPTNCLLSYIIGKHSTCFYRLPRFISLQLLLIPS